MVENQIAIGRFSQVCRLTVKALKVYEKRGILVPEQTDTLTGYRYYSPNQITRGVMLAQLAWAKFSLDEMEQFLKNWQQNDPGSIEHLVKSKLEAIESETKQLATVKEFLTKYIASDQKTLASRIQIKDVSEVRVLSKRELGTYGQTIGKLIGEIYRHIRSQPNQELIRVSGPVIFVAHDTEFKETDADIEMAVPITGPIKGSENIILKKLEPFKMACIVHPGLYDNLHNTYQEIFAYIQAQKRDVVAPTREIYLNSPGQVPLDQLLTEIQIPIQKLEV